MPVLMNKWAPTKVSEVRYMLRAPRLNPTRLMLYLRIGTPGYSAAEASALTHTEFLYNWDFQSTDEEMARYIYDLALIFRRALDRDVYN